jgi:hypothetical protein
MCVGGKKKLRDVEGIKKKELYIRVQVSVCYKETKKKTCFFKEKEAFGQERKNKFKQGKFLNLKVLKLWLLLGKMSSHF